MRIVERLTPFLGAWSGVNRLRLLPTDDYRESAATATVAVTAGEFVTIAYTWADGEEPQNGLLLLGGSRDNDDASAIWVDSWHCAPRWMEFTGVVHDDGVRVLGSYAAPPGPDWGWQIHVHPGDGHGGRISMENIVPGEEPYQAVEIILHQRG
jgi:hypothetical protein